MYIHYIVYNFVNKEPWNVTHNSPDLALSGFPSPALKRTQSGHTFKGSKEKKY